MRAAAKNHEHVTILTDPDQYAICIAGPTTLEQRRVLACRAFSRTAEYDASIARYLEAGAAMQRLPGSLTLTLPLAKALRYGENPQSAAAFYLPREEQLQEQLHGKDLSYNNLLDLDATLRLLVRSHHENAPPTRQATSERQSSNIPYRVALQKPKPPAMRSLRR